MGELGHVGLGRHDEKIATLYGHGQLHVVEQRRPKIPAGPRSAIGQRAEHDQ